MTKRIISLILSLVLLFSTTIPAFASDDLTDTNEADQFVEEMTEETEEEEFFETEDNESDVEEDKNDKANIDDSENETTDVEESEQGDDGDEKAPEVPEDSVGAPVNQLDMPKISKLINTPEGVEIFWNTVSGAQNYRVLLLEKSGKWKKLADTDATSYTWTGAQEGVFYVFSIRCVSSDGETYTSDFDEVGTGIVYQIDGLEDEQTEVGDLVDGEAEIETSEEGAVEDEEFEENEQLEADAEAAEEGEVDVEESEAVDEVLESTVSSSVATIAFPIDDVPKINRLINTPEGIALSWGAITGAAKYRVFYKTGSSGWNAIADTTATNYTWTGAQTGYAYIFTVRCVSADGSTYTSDFNRDGEGIIYTPTQLKDYPELRQNDEWIKSTPDGVKLTWGAVLGAQKYRVFYKTETSGWNAITDTTATSYTWTGAKSNTPYSFTVRCVTSDGKSYTSDFHRAGVSIVYDGTVQHDAPKVKVAITSDGVAITWNKVPDAQKYRVFYRIKGGRWTPIIDTAATSYTWTGVQTDVEYTFTVTCISADGSKQTSDFIATESIIYKPVLLDIPQLSSVASTTNGVKIAWDGVPNAQKYRVYYRIGSGSWNAIVDTTATSYTWTGAKSGTTYTFTVRCITADGKKETSDFNRAGMSVTYTPTKLATPILSSVSNTSKGVAISWEEVPGAEKYRVFYKTATTGWNAIADVTSLNYVWLGAEEDVRYTFTVRCLASDGSYASDFDSTGLSILYKPTDYDLSKMKPGPLKFVNAPNGISIYWDAVMGAEKYCVFVKNDAGRWTKLTTTNATSYTWTGAEDGETYWFTLRCVHADGETYMSEFDGTGWDHEYNADQLAMPVLNKPVSTPYGVSISWKPVVGAQKYRVYYTYEGIGWKPIADTTSTTYTWNGALSGIKYTFTVRCVTLDGSKEISDFDKAGVTLVYKPDQLPIPSQLRATNTEENPNHVTISWDPVTGAEKYRVFYRTGGGSWTKIIDTASTEYTWTEAEGNTTYDFTVRCITADGKTYTSDFDKAGVTLEIEEYDAPSNVQWNIRSNGSVEITWDKIPGAYRYCVYYKVSDTNWPALGETTTESFVWSDAKPGTTYTVSVCAVSYDGSFRTGKFDTKGITFKVPELAAPQLIAVVNTGSGVEITWNAVARAQKYRVFYREVVNGVAGRWTPLIDTTSTRYIWTDAKPSTTYTFTVRCIASDGEYTSDFNSQKTITTWDKGLTDIVAGGSYRQSNADSMLDLVNDMRLNDAWYWKPNNSTKTNLSNVGKLEYDSKLEQVAMQRAAELEQYYGNTRPNGKGSYTSLEYDGIRSSCEIIGRGYSSADEMFSVWAAADGKYEDQGNRRSLLSSYTRIGIACFEYRGSVYWVVEMR